MDRDWLRSRRAKAMRAARGEPLGADQVKSSTKKAYTAGWLEDSSFPRTGQRLRASSRRVLVSAAAARSAGWVKLAFGGYKAKYSEGKPRNSKTMENADLPAGWDKDIQSIPDRARRGLATRDSSGQVLNAIAKRICRGLSAVRRNLNPSTKTFMKFRKRVSSRRRHRPGGNVHFGVREHGMGIMNGMASAF